LLPVGGGKTACYQSLQAALTAFGRNKQQQLLQLRQQQSKANEDSTLPDEEVQHQFQVHAHVLNPKSVSLSELYGSYSPITHDWADGLLQPGQVGGGR